MGGLLENLRASVVETLQLLASEEAQKDYQARVPDVDVPMLPDSGAQPAAMFGPDNIGFSYPGGLSGDSHAFIQSHVHGSWRSLPAGRQAFSGYSAD